jgi:O-antigen ligase
MTTASKTDTRPLAARPLFLSRAIEGCWLAAAFLVPLLVMHESWMEGFIQLPKVFAFRTLALLLIVLIAFEWALTVNRVGQTGLEFAGLARRAWSNFKTHPARLVIMAASTVLSAVFVSVLASPVKSIGVWGVDPGRDTYGLFNVIPYLLYFGVIAARLRSREQVNRLMWILTATSILISVYGAGQHWGIDMLQTAPTLVDRIPLTFGNPIFGAAYLIMTIPLTLAVFMPYRNRLPAVTHVWIGSGLITIQLTALTFTFSRGPWVGFVIGALAFALAFAFVFGWRQTRRPGAILGLALALAMCLSALPVNDAPVGNPSFGQTVGSIAPDVAGGLNNRWTIWKTALDVYQSTPWLDTDQFPEIPELSIRWLRPFIGYGPDMFGYAYPLAGDSVYTRELATHGHNFIIHNLLEIGLLGVLAYIFLFTSIGVMLYRLLRNARAGSYPPWFSYLVVAMTWVLVARGVEQIPGKAQISDLHLMWLLAGFMVALVSLAPQIQRAVGTPASTAEDPPLQRKTRRALREQPSLSVVGVSIPRVIVAGGIAIIAITLWSQAVVNHVWAATVSADAQVATRQGLTQKSIDLSLRAIEIAPSAPLYKINLAEVYFHLGLQTDRALVERIALFQNAYELASEALDRNPVDHRAWSRRGEYQRELAVLIPGNSELAVRDSTILVNLMPGFWQVRTALAWSYVRLQDYQSALDTVQAAKDIRMLDSGAGGVAYFIQATALEKLGRADEARAAAHCALSYKPTSRTLSLLERLGETVPDQLTLIAADFVICPEQIPTTH